MRVANTSVNSSTQGYNAAITSVWCVCVGGGGRRGVNYLSLELRMRNHGMLFKAKPMAQLREGFEAVQIGHGPVTTMRETPKCESPSARTQLQAPKFESTKKLRKIRNAWGNTSYADLITQAILSAPEKRLTLSEIYDWIVQNVPYFSDKADIPSASGWKVSAVYG